MRNDDFTCITRVNASNDWAMSIIPDADKNIITCVGIDCEWNHKLSSHDVTRKLQLSIPHQKIDIMHLSKMNILTPGSFLEILRNLLEMESFLHCGHQASIDCSIIKRFEVKLSKRFELRDAVLCDEPEMSGTSIEDLASKYLAKLTAMKIFQHFHCLSNYNGVQLLK